MTTPTTVQVRLQLRADTAANWTSINPVLLANELGRETDTGKIKIGNGSTAWNSLAYQAWATLPIAVNVGGTGQTTYTNGQLLIGNTTGNTLTKATLTAGSGIAITNGSGAITVAASGISDAQIAAGAEIAVSKLADGTPRQLLQTDAAGTGVEWASNIDIPGTLDVTSAATFDSSVAVTGALTKSGNNVVTVGDTGTVTSAMIANGTIVDDDISATAEIAVSKLADGAARQLLQTDAAGTGVEWANNIDVPGTLDVTGAATFDNNVVIQGDLTVNGTETIINTQTLEVEDKNIIVGKVTTPTDITADGGGITLKGTTDKTINWIDATDAWTLSEHVNIASAKEYRIAGTKVLDATSLGSGVTGSSLTSVGTIGTGVWQGTAINKTYLDNTLVSTGDTGTVTSTMIADGTIVDGDISASAAIVDTKLATISTAGKVSNSATTATDANTASAIVARDASGNFSAGTITANLSGNASTVTTNANLTGDVTSVGNATSIAAGVIVNADVNASAAIAGTKISPDFGSQTIATTGIVSHALGTAGAPTVTFTGDTNTGIYSPGADQVAISTGGSGRLFVDASGNVGVGGNSNSYAGLTTLTVNSSTGSVVDWNISNTRTGTFAVTSSQVSLGSNTNIPVIFTQANSEKMRLTSTGLGVGTSAPATALQVNGDIRTSGAAGTGYELNDANTKISIPAANSIAFSTSGIERIRINNTGNVGIGTTSAGSYSTYGNKLVVYGTGTNGPGMTIATGTTDTGSIYFADGTTGDQAYRGSVQYSHSTDALIFGTAANERARIDSSGRWLLGTSSSSAGTRAVFQGQSSGAGSGAQIHLQRDQAAGSIGSGQPLGIINFADNAANVFATVSAVVDATEGTNDYPGRLVFSTTADGASSPTERMRIDKDGNTRFLGQNVVVTRMQRNSGTGTVIELGIDGNTPGTISCTTTTTSYNTSSDYRLKENVTTVTDGITRLQQLKPSRFNFIEDPDRTVDGFIAHEVQAVVPEAITGEKDAEDEDGKPIYQGIDQSKLVPLLTAALQEAIGRIETLEAEVAALKAQ